MYDGLKECIPVVIRNREQSVGSFGLTEVEFNKVLERGGFIKLRNRCNLPNDVQVRDFAKSNGTSLRNRLHARV